MSDEEQEKRLNALKEALETGKAILSKDGTALDAVEAVVRYLEDCPLFNAGKGGCLDEKGNCHPEASIMDGSTLRCGAVSGTTTVKNPVSLARKVMENTQHIFIISEGAEKFADANPSIERVDKEYFITEKTKSTYESILKSQENQDNSSKMGTVGCVAKDSHGNLAVATSTGGMTFKMLGRVGDSPLIGSGTYANAHVAVSGTGTGEEFIRHCIAHDIAARVQYGKLTLAESVKIAVHETLPKDVGGVITVDKEGTVVMDMNSEGMYRASGDSEGNDYVAIWE
eukprot:TRINITY_DN20449_c0_g1_i1.p1 TRINITY_DN20449_c0_g1~~TRINITY_DN20449_c0_g1_i1.p1  ORF type:complete len:299 (+),score=73.65 TRINITY_DN20449_c0_g1_i1:48-899(+)